MTYLRYRVATFDYRRKAGEENKEASFRTKVPHRCFQKILPIENPYFFLSKRKPCL